MKDGIREYIICDLLDGQSVGDSDDLLLSGLVDSLGVMRLVTFLEDTYGIVIEPHEVVGGPLDTVADIVRTVQQKRGA